MNKLSEEDNNFLEILRETYLEARDKESGTISDRIKTLAPSLIALNWILIGNASYVVKDRNILVYSAIFALFALIADFIQYFCGYIEARNKISSIEKARSDKAHFDSIQGNNLKSIKSRWILAKSICFYAKIILMFISIALLTYVVIFIFL